MGIKPLDSPQTPVIETCSFVNAAAAATAAATTSTTHFTNNNPSSSSINPNLGVTSAVGSSFTGQTPHTVSDIGGPRCMNGVAAGVSSSSRVESRTTELGTPFGSSIGVQLLHHEHQINVLRTSADREVGELK